MSPKLLLLGIVIALTLLGCQTTGTAAAKNDTAIKQISIGRSQQADVRRLLGIPTMVYSKALVAGTTRDVWAYNYRHHEMDWMEVVPILNFYSRGGKTEEASVNVYFDASGVVADVQVNRRKEPN